MSQHIFPIKIASNSRLDITFAVCVKSRFAKVCCERRVWQPSCRTLIIISSWVDFYSMFCRLCTFFNSILVYPNFSWVFFFMIIFINLSSLLYCRDISCCISLYLLLFIMIFISLLSFLLLLLLLEFCCGFCINKESVLISLLTLPFCRTFIKFFHLHVFETIMVSIVPLEDIFHTMCFFTEKTFLSPVIGLKFRYYNLNQNFISYNLI